MIEDRSFGAKLFNLCNYLFLTVVSLMCLLPLVHVAARSFSDRAANTSNIVVLWPLNFTALNYFQLLVADNQFIQSMGISITRTLLGTLLYLFVIVLTAYPLSKRKGFPGRDIFKYLLIFSMLFSGGLIPTYLAVRSLGLVDTIGALIFPGMVQAFYIIVMINFFRGIPEELSEAAIIDGASQWSILFRIYLPLSLPAIATLLLFCSVDHWNSWFDGLIYMTKTANYPLQTYLQSRIISSDFTRLMNPLLARQLSEKGLRSAQIILTTLPILIVYPFVQRYFVTGLTLGSIKG